MRTEILQSIARRKAAHRWSLAPLHLACVPLLSMLAVAAAAVFLAAPAAAQTTITVSGPATLPQTESGTYTATIVNPEPGSVNWSASPAGLTLSSAQNGVQVTAGTTAGRYTLTATDGTPPASASASFTITVLPPPVTYISPVTVSIAAGQTITFTASVVNSTNPYFFWWTNDDVADLEGSGAYPFQGLGPSATFSHAAAFPGGSFQVNVLSYGDNQSGTAATAIVQVVSVAVAPATVDVVPGSSRQFVGEVTGSQQALQWSTTLPGATFSSSGLLQVPATAAAGSYTVTCQTIGSPVATGTATLTVVNSMPVTGVAVAPLRSVIASGAQEPFTAVVEDPNGEPHPNQAVTWSVSGPTPASVAANGLFTAPAVPGVYAVTATAAADGTKSGTATVTVGEDLMVLPSSASLAPGASQAFTAQVSGVSSPSVAWSVEEGATGGSVSAAGFYTAPASPGVYHVLALATDAGAAVQGMATVVVSASPSAGITLSPSETAIAAGGMQQFTAAVVGPADTAVTWSASAGSIDPTGLFTAPAREGTVTITATSHADPGVQATATAVVTTAGQAQAFQYDANGNLLADGTRTYEWDVENRLTAINIGSQRSEFTYDWMGHRVMITEKSNGAVTTSRHYIWIDDQLVEETDATTAIGAGPAPIGGFDAITCSQLAGWGWSSAEPDTPIHVDIYDGSTKIASVLANGYRADVRAAGAGNGYHGFTFPTPASLKTNTQHSVTVMLGGTSTSLGTRTVTCAAASFGGDFDAASCTQLAGWAWDASQATSPINVDVYDGTTLLTTVLASTFRQDLFNAGIGNGDHSFFLPTPASLKNGVAHSLSLKISGTSIGIGPTLALTCGAASFAGSLDGADCTQIAGWAWDANQPNAAVNVDIYDGSTLLTTIAAATLRQDLKNAGLGNGVHAFYYSSPALYTGTTHSISVHYSGTATALPGSPKSITCPTESILTRFFPGGMQSSGANYYFSYDHLASVREVTDGSGNVVSRYDYDPYGRLTVNQGVPPRFGFAGFYYHQPSGLSLTHFRAYDPDLGRWASRDPAAESDNPYEYASDDPVDFYDPDGAAPILPTNPPSPLPPGWGPTLPDGSPENGPDGMPKGLDNSPPFSPDYPIRWAPDPQNDRGGNWYQPGNPKAPKKSWEANAPVPHWDKDDGNGNRTRCTKDGKPVTADEAHDRKTQPPGTKPSKMQQILDEAKRLLDPMPFLQWLAEHPPNPPSAAPPPPMWLILAGI